jgi:ornithine decarboxylase
MIVCNSKEFLDLRKFDNPINSIELIKNITTNKNVENDPFYIVDLEDICNKHINWITRLPRVEPHYAIKCNTDPMLLKLLAFLGAGFDCASKNEIQKVLDLGVSPHRIIFANPCKQASYIKYANKVGVDYMTFDNEFELKKIKEAHPNAKCVLRIITNDADAVCRFSMKFGADMESSLKLIETASKLNLDLVGVSFHVGSGQMSPRAFSESIENARRLFDYARENFGIKMHFLDLGGGYPGSSDSTDLFNSIAKEINKALDEHFPADLFAQINGTTDDDHKLRIIAEPGRYYACSAFTLCVSVIAKRVMTQNALQQAQDKETALSKLKQQKALQSQLAKENEELPCMNKYGELSSSNSPLDTSKSIMYYVNDGVYASFNCLFYDHAECFPVLINEKHKARDAETTLYKSSIWGPTCDGLDVISKECFLPELETGEFMVFKNMGAYTISGAVPFNGIPLARCIYTASTSWNIIKNAFDEQPAEDAHTANVLLEIMSCSLSFAKNIHQQQQFNMDSTDINRNTFDTSDEENANEEMSNEDNGISANKQDCAITC